jgi:hypothetical protein
LLLNKVKRREIGLWDRAVLSGERDVDKEEENEATELAVDNILRFLTEFRAV